jgi:RNA polymerase sigma factor (sigma-70 family)
MERSLVPLTVQGAGGVDEELDALVTGISAGNPEAEARLCALMRPALLDYARSLLGGDPPHAEGPEDAVQDSLLRFILRMRGRPGFRGRPRSYLRRIVRNRCVDFQRLASWRLKRLEDGSHLPELPPGEEIVAILQGLQIKELLEGMERLDPACRQLLERIYLQGVPVRKIAREVAVPTTVQAVYSRRNRCLKLLAFRLKIWGESRFGDMNPHGTPRVPPTDEGGDEPTRR